MHLKTVLYMAAQREHDYVHVEPCGGSGALPKHLSQPREIATKSVASPHYFAEASYRGANAAKDARTALC